MPRSSPSLESLSSPSPSPPPPRQRASPPPQHHHDPASLDSGSELSELTEDEQDSAETKSKANVRKQPTRRTRRELIPDRMWGWYKKKSLSDEQHSGPPNTENHVVRDQGPHSLTDAATCHPSSSTSPAMPSPSASLESLSSPSPSPPPPRQRASPPPQHHHDPASLDSGSELSELTEDEQDSAETKSKANIRKQPTRRTRRELIPDQMWGWYNKKGLPEEKLEHSGLPDSSNHSDHRNSLNRQSKTAIPTIDQADTGKRGEECSFCRGTDNENNRGQLELMVTCTSCGRSGVLYAVCTPDFS
jgi:hypothetical protein